MKKYLLKSLFEKLTPGQVKVVYWDGEEVNYGSDKPKVTIRFRKPLPASFDLDNPILSFGEAYMDGVLDFEGRLEDLYDAVAANKDYFAGKGLQHKLYSAFKSINVGTSKTKQKDNIQHHYDLGNDFFSLWLDETMNYSCGYFNSLQDSLYQAQLQKVEYIIKKIRLQAGERLLDIGSGWGWLIISAAQQYDIRALGITLSEEQYEHTRETIKKLGLKDRVEVKLENYLDLDENKDRFDKITSVGMFEHVGKDDLPRYMEKVHKLLKPGGLSMLHTITKPKEIPINRWIDKYIFPGGYIPSLRETIWLLAEHDFHLIHAESLRIHYAMTLDRWHENYCQQWDKVEKKFGKRFVRMWDLYLRSCAASFRVSGLNIHQLLFSKGLNNDLPLTMADLYHEKTGKS